jgi:hypothetical protein
MTSLDKILRKFCLEGKARFYFSEFIEQGNVSVEEAEKFLIPLMGKGKIQGELELRCPNCGKDLGTFQRLPEIPQENICPICGHGFCKSFEYIEIVLEVKGDFFLGQQIVLKSPNAFPSKEMLVKLMTEALLQKEAAPKGKMFEEFFESLMFREPDFEMIDKHSRSEIGEVDYAYQCKVRDNILWENSPIICIECKNWSGTIGSENVDHFINLVREKSPFSSCGVYVTSSSFSPQAKTSMRDARVRDKITIVPIEKRQLISLIEYGFKSYIPKVCLDTILHR